jgi:hypothetical protein
MDEAGVFESREGVLHRADVQGSQTGEGVTVSLIELALHEPLQVFSLDLSDPTPIDQENGDGCILVSCPGGTRVYKLVLIDEIKL